MSNSSSGGNPWDAAVQWISHHGGFVNPLLCYDASNRQVSVKEVVSNVAHGRDGAESAAKCVIEEGDLLLQIPDACLLSLHTIEATTFGRTLFAVIHSLLPGHDANDGASHPPPSKRSKVDTMANEKDSQLYNDEQDVIMALFLAYLMENKDREEPTVESCNDDTSEPWLFYRPYLDTLPIDTSNSSSGTSTNEYLNLLPRQWPLEIIDQRLKGTSLYQRVLAEKKGLVDEYDKIKSAWQSNNHSELLPSLESYDMMMAAVSSRGFSGLGYDGVDVMIPILDLLNHARGSCDENAKMIDNVESRAESGVRYKRYENSDNVNTRLDDSSPSATDVSSSTVKRKATAVSKSKKNNGGVKVTAAGNLHRGMKLLMTYGAKSNASLLGRYGFCIQNNYEPDGSCNDIVEIQLHPEKDPVRLQMGPKSYSYLPFVEALSLFYNTNSDFAEKCITGREERENEAGSMDGEGFDLDDNVDAFLDACDNESYGENEALDCYDTSLEDSIVNEQPTDKKRMKSDVFAVNSLIKALGDAKSQRSTNKHTCNDKRMYSIQEQYCFILAESEIHTILFFLAISLTLKQQLEALCEESAPDVSGVLEIEGIMRSYVADETRRKHAVDVVNAFMTIRASGKMRGTQ